MFTVIALSNDEQFLEFLDTDLLEITETHEIGGLRTVKVDYTFNDLQRAKELFKSGNKLWIQGHNQLTDCLYVLNTEIQQDLADEHRFSFEAEEVLVELNYARLATQTELTAANGFSVTTTSDAVVVTVDYNALSYWFDDYYNIGIIQDCIGTNSNRVSFTGTMTLMSLLRLIEESTGNVFVTRYEKDVLDNTIHRYLDFLNPNSSNKNWQFNVEYEFIEAPDTTGVLDEDDNPTTDTYDDVEATSDLVTFDTLPTWSNLTITDTVFKLTDENGTVLVNDNDEELSWTAAEIGITDECETIVIQLSYTNNALTLSAYEKIYINDDTILAGKSHAYISTALDSVTISGITLANGSYFTIVDDGTTVYSHMLNSILCDVHTDVLDLAYNVENMRVNVDESDTFSAISPILSLDENSNGLTRSDMNTIINNWLNLEVEAGDTIPMIVERVNQSGTSYSNAVSNLGEYSLTGNYFSRPLKPQDNTDSDSDKQYEFFRGTAYWSAPFTKLAGDMDITIDKKIDSDYDFIKCRPDTRDPREFSISTPKMGTVETSDENIYAIYNDVAMKLKEKSIPNVEVEVDVGNLTDLRFNDYNLYEKVYIKLPGTDHLIEAQVDSTSKNARIISENTVGLSNYNLQVPAKTYATWIDSSNRDFDYPNSETLTAILVNDEYDSEDSDSQQFLSGKLMTFTVYSIDSNNTRTFKKAYTKKTNANGMATITMKYNPGEYEIEVKFAGDVEYEESAITVEVSVGGTIEKTKSIKTKYKSKTVKKDNKTKYKKRYWSKCGKSPDKKKVIGIGKYSASQSDARKFGLNYKTIYQSVFKNKCPSCGKSGTLVFDGGKGTSCVNKKWHSRGYKIEANAEHEITCYACDSDYDCITGLNKASSHKNRLKMLEKPIVSGKSEYKKLIKGKLYYDTVKESKTKSTKTSSKTRSDVSSGIPSSVKKKALSIVGDSKGWAACKKIADFCGKKIKYDNYTNHKHSPAWVLKHKKGNCCDQTRLMLTMMDAAGCREYVTLKYVHCHKSNKGHVFARVIHKRKGKKVYVDPCCSANPWGNYLHGYGPIVGTKTYTYGGTGY